MSTASDPITQHSVNEVKLNTRQIWQESGDHCGQVVTCLHGVVWLTHECMPGDFVLLPGQEFVVSRRGLLLAQGLRDAVLLITDRALPDSAAAKASLN